MTNAQRERIALALDCAASDVQARIDSEYINAHESIYAFGVAWRVAYCSARGRFSERGVYAEAAQLVREGRFG